tara:strand:+ start:378 stop:1613 length:1236 start_codon:yes stop_codon:yes gene_type:complete
LVEVTQIVLILVLVILSAISSGSETALVSINELKTKTLVKQEKKGAQALYRLKKDPKKLLITILIWNNLVNISAASLAALIALDIFGSAGLGISTGIMTLIILIFGEIIPKSYATNNNEKIALKVAKPIELLSKFLYPITTPLMKLSDWLTRAKKNNMPIVTEEELKSIIEIGEQEKIIEKHEKEFMHRIIKTGDTTAREVMIPRNKMYVLDSNMSVEKAMNHMIKSKYTRAPIIKNSNDNIIGIIHLKQLLSANQEGQGQLNIMKIARKPIFVSQKEIVGNLLRELQLKREHMSIVVDEFGGVEGLLTLEDLLEEIVGEIIDESEDLSKSINKIDDNTISIHGDTEIEKIEEYFKIKLTGVKEITNINGLLHNILKDLPKQGDKVEFQNLILEVKELRDNRPNKVIIKKK